MAESPKYKLYSPAGAYVAAFKWAEDAAVLCSVYGDGATIRDGHLKRNVVFTQGANADGDAGESYDSAAALIHERQAEKRRQISHD